MADLTVPGNGYPKGKVRDFVKRIEDCEEEILKHKTTFMNRAKKIKGDINDVLDEAKEELGISKKVLRGVVKRRALAEKAEGIRDKFEEDEMDQYDLVRDALGELDDEQVREEALARANARKEDERAAMKDLEEETAH